MSKTLGYIQASIRHFSKRTFLTWTVSLIVLLLTIQSVFAITYQYDALGRLVEVAYDDGRKVFYRYDPAGNRTEVVDLNNAIPTQGMGPNLIDLSGWPVGSVPSGAPTVSGWPNGATYYNEARWSGVTGPQNSAITAMEAGQTEPDGNGGGVSNTNLFTIDKTRGYEYSLYFKKHDLTAQSLYFGVTIGGVVRNAINGAINTNPYILAMNTTSQSTYLDDEKWYKIVGFVLPQGFPDQTGIDWGGIYEVDSGAKIANVTAFRWNEDDTATQADARFFTYYSESIQNLHTTYFYQPEARLTAVSFTPVVPSMSVSHSDATEGSNIVFTVTLSAATTVTTKVNYVVAGAGGSNGASSNDYTATSGTLVIPFGQTSGTVSVATNTDSLLEVSEAIKLTLSSPIRATIASGETTETALIIDDGTGPGPSFSVNDVSASEGNNLNFVVTKTGTSVLSHSVNYITAHGTASNNDYLRVINSTTLTFGPSETSKTISLPTYSDSLNESSETMYLNLSSPTNNATISDAQGVGTITNVSNFIVVVNSSGVAQSPYQIVVEELEEQGYFYSALYNGSNVIYEGWSWGGLFCSQTGSFYDSRYSFSGTGCEVLFQP